MSGLSSRHPSLVRYLRCPELMDRMMERVGVAPAEAACVDGGLAWLEASTKCIFCRHAGTCCSWLEGSDTHTTPADFCPNAEFFDSCAKHSTTGAEGSIGGALTKQLQSMLAPSRDDDAIARLTDRQKEVLRFIGEGKSNKEIARSIGRSDETVKVHVSAILRRLEVKNRTEAAFLASRLPLTAQSALRGLRGFGDRPRCPPSALHR